MRVEDKLDCSSRRKREVPYYRFLVRRRDDPVGVGGVGRPLHVCNRPGGQVGEEARRVVWVVKVDDVEA